MSRRLYPMSNRLLEKCFEKANSSIIRRYKKEIRKEIAALKQNAYSSMKMLRLAILAIREKVRHLKEERKMYPPKDLHRDFFNFKIKALKLCLKCLKEAK
jgi:hypothetical protein